MPQKHMEYFTLLLDHLAWIEHQFLSGIRDSRKAGRMRGVGGVRKSIHQSWLAKGLGLSLGLLYCIQVWRDSIRKRPALFKSGQWYFHQDNAPVHNSILVIEYLTKMGINTIPHRLYRPDLAQKLSLWDNWGNERGCDEDHWHAHTRGLPWGLPEVVGTVQQVYCSRRRLLRRGLEFHVCTINKSAHTKKV